MNTPKELKRIDALEEAMDEAGKKLTVGSGALVRPQEELRHTPAITPSLLFTEEEVASVDWEAVFAEWN